MKYLKTILGIAVILIALSAPFFVIPRILKVNKIDCRSQYGACMQILSDKLDKAKGASLFDAKKAVKSTLYSDLTVSHFSVQYKFPDTLAVNILVRKPFFALKEVSGGPVALVDAAGVVIEKKENSVLPIITIENNIPDVGDKVEASDLFASKVLYGIFYLYNTKVGTIENDTLLISLPLGPRVLFPLVGDSDVLLGSINLILSRLNKAADISRIENIKEIDLRFQNPVLR